MSRNSKDEKKLDRRGFLKLGTLLPVVGLGLPHLRAAESCQSTTAEGAGPFFQPDAPLRGGLPIARGPSRGQRWKSGRPMLRDATALTKSVGSFLEIRMTFDSEGDSQPMHRVAINFRRSNLLLIRLEGDFDPATFTIRSLLLPRRVRGAPIWSPSSTSKEIATIPRTPSAGPRCLKPSPGSSR